MNQFKELTPEYKQLIKTCCQALEDTKAENITVLNVSAQSSLTDFLILASAMSSPHLKALKRDLDQTLKDHKVKVLGGEAGDDTGWSVVDAFDVMIHLFTPDMRETYSLETLWKDSLPVSPEDLLAEQAD
jgi:ribosome-associated protein